jgi:heme exporter protein B
VSPRPPSLVRTAWLVLKKDLLIEWRTKARLNALVFFSVATLLLFSFALGPDTQLMQRNAAGYLWLALLLANVLSLGESFRVEQENAALDGLRLVPADARAIFLGKAFGNAVLLYALSWVLLPVMVGLTGVKLALSAGELAQVLALGCLALSAPGTVYAAIANHARARDVLLPLLLFPILIPALVGAVKGTALIFEGDPMLQLGSWMKLLSGFNLLYWGLGFLLFPRVIED